MWHSLTFSTEEEWLEWRRNGIGSSDAAAIVGISPWSTPYQKWEEKVFGKNKKESAAMRYGKTMEGKIRSQVEELFGERFYPANIQRLDIPWIRASLDGLNQEQNRVIEIKRANANDHAMAKNGIVPPKYYPQCQHILYALDLPIIYYISSHNKEKDPVVVEVPRDENYINESLILMEKEFWRRVQDFDPPPLTEADEEKVS